MTDVPISSLCRVWLFIFRLKMGWGLSVVKLLSTIIGGKFAGNEFWHFGGRRCQIKIYQNFLLAYNYTYGDPGPNPQYF